ncbi:uncharacterized protein BDZ99DRAFT_95204 [Mytilinidion resinicola]|uniref:Magnesium chelatase n=1 Tax=Mytilinidion resinicola TaxID=574789 RepID=A0A6A6YCL8_9PEZI|nr:uncharacterized protein BDZ99DRAFT_95204 [Mytilinidion resinicola]KAF2806450.1 hypothetical protein BDZ99DRAFT_95204 [Mytilinidion resinicola]
MDHVAGTIVERVQSLSDIELASLLCLVADQHCIIEAEEGLLDGVEREIQLVSSDVFGLSCCVLNCSESTTLDDFGKGILVTEDDDRFDFSERRRSNDDYFSSFSISDQIRHSEKRVPRSPGAFNPLDSRKIANIVIAKNLNETHQQVQIQALELIRGKRVFTRTAVHAAPKPFLFIALNASESEFKLIQHLNDQFFISHRHFAEDGLPNLEELLANANFSEDGTSASSVIRSTPMKLPASKPTMPIFSQDDLNALVASTAEVRISPEIRAYMHNIIVFLRLHRAVAGGISAASTRHFSALVRALAPLHGYTYASPSLVTLATSKIFRHRIVLTTPENERSMQWGSSLDAVKAVLDGVTAEDVIEEVLHAVEVPL